MHYVLGGRKTVNQVRYKLQQWQLAMSVPATAAASADMQNE